LLKRTTSEFLKKKLTTHTDLKILDIGCGYTANPYATHLADTLDLRNFYKGKNFVLLQDEILPFKDKEFDFIISSHVLEHVADPRFFISELERIGKEGYIEVPTRLEDNLVFENKSAHLWWINFDDNDYSLLIQKKKQIIEPFLTVSSSQFLRKYFDDSLTLKLLWNEKIPYKILNEEIYNENVKLSFWKIIKKYFSKKIRSIK